MNKESEEKLLEEDLYKPVYDYLVKEGYSVRSEVKNCDVVAVKQDEMVIVELKRSMNMELILQGIDRQKITAFVYLAVPRPKGSMNTSRWKGICNLLKRLELGLIMVVVKKDFSFAEAIFHPSSFNKERKAKSGKSVKSAIMTEIQGRHGDQNTGGSCRKKLMTAYRESAIHISCCLKRFGPLSPKKLRDLGTDSKKTFSILANNHYGWFEKIDKGLYGLSELGLAELESYSQMVEYYMKKVDENIK